MTNDIRHSLNLIAQGNRKEIKRAKKDIWNFIREKDNRGSFIKHYFDMMKDFDSIEDESNRIAFIYITHYTAMIKGKEFYSELSDFLIRMLTDDNGHLRRSALNTFDYLLSAIALNGRSIDPDKIHINALQEFCLSFDEILELRDRCKPHNIADDIYIDELKPSVYKSIMQFMELMERFPSLTAVYYMHQCSFDFSGDNFTEKFHDTFKWHLYYEAMDYLLVHDTDIAGYLLYRARTAYPDFVGAYVGMVELYKLEGNIKRMNIAINRGFDLTITDKAIVNRDASWYNIEDRQYFRALLYKAKQLHSLKQYDSAEKLYVFLLELNPRDHQCVRYYLAGLYERMTPSDVDKIFEKCENKQNWSEIAALLNKHPDIFDWLEADSDWE